MGGARSRDGSVRTFKQVWVLLLVLLSAAQLGRAEAAQNVECGAHLDDANPGSDNCAEARAQDAKTAAKLRSQADDALMKREYKRAISLLTEAISVEPMNDKNYYKRSRAYDKSGKYKEELRDLNKVLDMAPENLSALSFRGKTHMSLGMCKEASEDLAHVLILKPTHGDAKKLLPKAKECADQISQAETFLAQGRYDLADRMVGEIMDVTGKVSFLNMIRAKARFALGNYFEAIADCGDILKKDSDNIEALLLRGKSYYFVADHIMATRHFKEALASDPDHKEAKDWFKRVQKFNKLTKAGEAGLKKGTEESLANGLEALTEALKLDPKHKEHNKVLHHMVCSIHAARGHTKPAQDACEAAFRMDQAWLDPLITIAEHLTNQAEETPQFEEALRAWQRAFELDRDNGRVRQGMEKAEVGLKQSKQKNYYKILGVKRNADKKTIKKSYRALAMEFHPDKHTDKEDDEKALMESKFELIAEAYEVLSSPELRGKYDRGEDVFENQGNNNRGSPFQRGFHFHQRRGY